jgi:hypothetical protein
MMRLAGSLGVAVLITMATAAPTGASGKSPGLAYVFCGLARTVNGFDLVDARGVACAPARSLISRIERGERGPWNCSRAIHAVFELRCQAGLREVRVLERSPIQPSRIGGVVRLRNWSFRVHGNSLLAREDQLGWVSLGPAPWCIPYAGPREVLVALRLRPITPHGGCFRTR